MRQRDALQDTGDTRETAAIDVCHGLIADDACLCIYDPQVSKDQIYRCVQESRMTTTSPSHDICQLCAELNQMAEEQLCCTVRMMPSTRCCFTATGHSRQVQRFEHVLTKCGMHLRDLAAPKFQWDQPMLPNGAQVPFSDGQIEKSVSISSDPYQVCPLAGHHTGI